MLVKGVCLGVTDAPTESCNKSKRDGRSHHLDPARQSHCQEAVVTMVFLNILYIHRLESMRRIKVIQKAPIKALACTVAADRTAGVTVGTVGDPLSSLCASVQGWVEHTISGML